MHRRDFLFCGGMALAGRMARGTGAGPGEIAHTPQGALQGVRTEDSIAFLGVPFAEPPVGPLRFLAPRPSRAWNGIRTATRYAAPPVQLRRANGSEDCLYLNVWTPRSPGPHPVLFWIYGGGNTEGATGGIADGSHFARDGVVCVTPAYRVGALGYLDLSVVLGDAYRGSGNNGVRDLILALRWVRNNIAAFGGDPERITVGGESAGAKDTCALMAAQDAGGLFTQAIMESGGGQTVHTRESAQELTQAFLRCGGLNAGDAAQLRDLPVESLMRAQRALIAERGAYPFRVTVDGVVLDRSPLEALRGGASRGICLLAGSNRDESSFFVRGAELAQPITSRELQNTTVEHMRELEPKYKQLFPDWTEAQRKIRLLTAEEYAIPTLRVAEAHTQAGGETYLYRLNYPLAKGPLAGETPHTADLSLVWGDSNADPESGGDADPAHHALMRSVHGAWVAFLRGSAPTLAGAPAWPRYNLRDRPVMLIDRTSTVAHDPDQAERRLWQGWPA